MGVIWAPWVTSGLVGCRVQAVKYSVVYGEREAIHGGGIHKACELICIHVLYGQTIERKISHCVPVP